MLCGNTWSKETAGAPRASVDLRDRFARGHMGGVQGAACLQQCNFAALDQIVGSTKAVVEPGVDAGGKKLFRKSIVGSLRLARLQARDSPKFSVIANRRYARRRVRSRFAPHCLEPA